MAPWCWWMRDRQDSLAWDEGAGSQRLKVSTPGISYGCETESSTYFLRWIVFLFCDWLLLPDSLKAHRKGQIWVDTIAHNRSTKCQNVNICSWQFRPWWRHCVISPVDWEVIKWPKGLHGYTGPHTDPVSRDHYSIFILTHNNMESSFSHL